VANADQADADGDGEGDACDVDDDNDGVVNDGDLCPGTLPGNVVDVDGCSAAQRDGDGDGVPDADDQCPDTPIGTEVDAAGCPVQPPQGEVCDVDGDADVDYHDLWDIIYSLRDGGDVAPGDPRDSNGNGQIDLFDVFICAASCDLSYCRSP
jgi:hypothetical protein